MKRIGQRPHALAASSDMLEALSWNSAAMGSEDEGPAKGQERSEGLPWVVKSCSMLENLLAGGRRCATGHFEEVCGTGHLRGCWGCGCVCGCGWDCGVDMVVVVFVLVFIVLSCWMADFARSMSVRVCGCSAMGFCHADMLLELSYEADWRVLESCFNIVERKSESGMKLIRNG